MMRFGEYRGGDGKIAAAQSAEHKICLRDVAVVDFARDEIKLVAVRHGADGDLKRDQSGVADEASQHFE